jgi:hypothetical protein
MPEKLLSHACMALVIDGESVRLLHPLNNVDAMALLACSAEDPATWVDVSLVWSRYKFHLENTEFAESFPIRQTSFCEAISLLEDATAWFVLDLKQRRVVTGGQFPLLRLRHSSNDVDGPLTHTTVLPPWWELLQHEAPNTIRSVRSTPLIIPNPRRKVLWGPSLTLFFAERMLALIQSGEEWIGKGWKDEPCGRRDLTLSIHRDWLMTPHAELNGGIPRDCLHIGKDWISDLADGQTFRVYQNEAPVPISAELSTFESAAMGRHEVILYFDACRETIDAGWLWLLQDQNRLEGADALQKLAKAMEEFLTDWRMSPFEGGESPDEVIHCERIRIPLVHERGSHMIDCDCPICEMMASGSFGPSICHFDGHSLDLDDDFAFSIHATREAWDAQQKDYEEMNARIEADRKRRELLGEDAEDPLDSPWKSTFIGEKGIPGDRFGHLGMAFLVAEIVGWLKTENAEQSDVDLLNTSFRDYRAASQPDERATFAGSFKHVLEQLAAKHPDLVSRAADLQSRIDERLRDPAHDLDQDIDVPF